MEWYSNNNGISFLFIKRFNGINLVTDNWVYTHGSELCSNAE